MRASFSNPRAAVSGRKFSAPKISLFTSRPPPSGWIRSSGCGWRRAVPQPAIRANCKPSPISKQIANSVSTKLVERLERAVVADAALDEHGTRRIGKLDRALRFCLRNESLFLSRQLHRDIASYGRHHTLCEFEPGQVRRHFDFRETGLGSAHAQYPPAQLVSRRGGEAVAQACRRIETFPQGGGAASQHGAEAFAHHPQRVLETAIPSQRVVEKMRIECIGEDD